MKLLFSLLMCIFSLSSVAQINDEDRYPYRVPDWLWKDQIRSAFIDKAERLALENKIRIMDSAYNANNDSIGDVYEKEINSTLNSKLSLVDLEKGTHIIKSPNNYKLAVQIDPNFADTTTHTLLKATTLFLQTMLDPDVIKEAYDNSTETPTPYPTVYDSSDISASNSIRKYTKAYAFLLKCRIRPSSPETFRSQLTEILTRSMDDPLLLVISSYKGNVWWGGGWYNYYHSTSQHLSKYSPTSGFLYIRLNTDSLITNHDPVFWASKIAHEALHNLGYWHPDYKDPEERNRNNHGKNQAFIVAYERAIFKKAQKQLKLNSRLN